jgi:hypothetical protein
MIFGSYPCCNATLAISMSEKAGYIRELCPTCGAAVWHLMSRIDPQSWTEDDFLKEHNVDEAAKTVTRIKTEADLAWEALIQSRETLTDKRLALLAGTRPGCPRAPRPAPDEAELPAVNQPVSRSQQVSRDESFHENLRLDRRTYRRLNRR